MCTTVVADDVVIEFDEGLGLYRCQVIQRSNCEVEVLVKQAVLQKAIRKAFAAMEVREEKPINVVAFR